MFSCWTPSFSRNLLPRLRISRVISFPLHFLSNTKHLSSLGGVRTENLSVAATTLRASAVLCSQRMTAEVASDSGHFVALNAVTPMRLLNPGATSPLFLGSHANDPAATCCVILSNTQIMLFRGRGSVDFAT